MNQAPLARYRTNRNSPTAKHCDVSLRLSAGAVRHGGGGEQTSGGFRVGSDHASGISRIDPPLYSLLDDYMYRDGVRLDLSCLRRSSMRRLNIGPERLLGFEAQWWQARYDEVLEKVVLLLGCRRSRTYYYAGWLTRIILRSRF
jgi:hypothetical protein